MNQKSILIIDDDPDLCRLMKMTLARTGARVITAGSAKDGLRLLYIHCPHLVLLDLLMPEVDGWETLALIRRVSDVPVILLSGMATAGHIIQEIDYEAVEYVAKPFSVKSLLSQVEKMLERTGQLPGQAFFLQNLDEGLYTNKIKYNETAADYCLA